MEEMLCRKFSRFMMRRAENFRILRRKAIEGYDIREGRGFRDVGAELNNIQISYRVTHQVVSELSSEGLCNRPEFGNNLMCHAVYVLDISQ